MSYFTRALILSLIFFATKNYGTITSHQAQKQVNVFNGNGQGLSSNDSCQSKCSRGGCQTGIELSSEYPLFVFISFSMPEEALISLSKELNTYRGAFVVQGLPGNSFAEFFDKLNQLKERGMEAPLLIDPDSFESYQVAEVPTILLREEKAFDKITGNIPVLHALERFAAQGETRSFARRLLSTSDRLEITTIRKFQ